MYCDIYITIYKTHTYTILVLFFSLLCSLKVPHVGSQLHRCCIPYSKQYSMTFSSFRVCLLLLASLLFTNTLLQAPTLPGCCFEVSIEVSKDPVLH